MKIARPAFQNKLQALKFSALLAALLVLLFWRSFLPGYIHFSNDGPLGQQNSAYVQLPAGFTGKWDDLNDIGNNTGAWPPDLNALFFWMLGAVGYLKFFPPLALFFLGFSAWCFFRQLNFSPLAAALGALAAALNSTFFANACWGVAAPIGCFQHGLSRHGIGFVHFFGDTTAHALDATGFGRVGRGCQCDGSFDIGAIFSLFVAAFVLFKAVTRRNGRFGVKMGRGIWTNRDDRGFCRDSLPHKPL